MPTRHGIESSPRMSNYIPSREVKLVVCGEPFTLDRELLAARSVRLAELSKHNPQEDLSHLLRDIPADPKTFELVARFCHGFDVDISIENVIRVACLANYFGMTENHSSNNLLKKALTYFQQKIIPSWNRSVRALRTITDNIFQQAVNLGFVDACADSIIRMALVDPHLLGEPIKNLTSDDGGEDNENVFRPNARRRLFVLDWKSEDLTALSLQLYEPIIRAMIHRQVPIEYVASSIYQYAKTWVFCSTTGGEDMSSIYKGNSQRGAIEVVQRLLPHERGLLPSSSLFEMLRSAIALEASSECRNGFELIIGKQLDQATAKDLLIPSQGYAKEEQYDTECVRRMLKHFYSNSTGSDGNGLITVAELLDSFLAEVAGDIDLKMSTFISLAELSVAASVGTQRSSDGIYRAIDIYFDKHRYLTNSEREEVCQVLDCSKMTPEGCEHAAQNERLPVRVVVQVLFAGQLHLRDALTKEVVHESDSIRKLEAEAEAEMENKEKAARVCSANDEDVRIEMEKVSSKVMELKKECHIMRKEIQSGACSNFKKDKVSMWKEMKRKFGCISSMHDCNCHSKKKKVHPR